MVSVTTPSTSQYMQCRTYLLTYLLTPCSRVLEKLNGSQLGKKFPAFYGTRRFITAVRNARHLSLSWARSIQSMPPHPNSWRSVLILSSHLRLVFRVVYFPQVSPPKLCTHLPSPHTCYISRPAHSARYDQPNNIWWGVEIIKDGSSEVGCGGMDWIELAQDRDRCRALLNAVMNIRVP